MVHLDFATKKKLFYRFQLQYFGYSDERRFLMCFYELLHTDYRYLLLIVYLQLSVSI